MGDDTEPDALLDEITPPKNTGVSGKSKKGAVAKKRSKKSIAAAAKAAERQAAEDLRNAEKAEAQRLAQIVNLKISGHSFADIGAQIGMSGDEVEQMLVRDAGKYVRTQSALRAYVRDWIGEKYTGLLDAVYTEATDRNHPEKLENSAQALRILDKMSRLYGADAPTQSEVKVEASPESVEQLVAALAAGKGIGYDTDVFDADIVEAEIVEDDEPPVDRLHQQALTALENASREVEEEHDGDEPLGG